MKLLISAALAIFPALFIVRYFYKKDAARPEPKGMIIKIFFIGILSTIPAIILEIILLLFESHIEMSRMLKIFFRSFIVAAFCEELIKLLVVKKYAYNNINFDEIMDGIVYTVVASMGFACLENIMYVIDGGLVTASLRAFTAVPLHAFSSGIMGFYIGSAKFETDKTIERYLIIKGLLIAILIHGLYDFAIFSMPIFGLASIIFVAALIPASYFYLMRKVRSAIDQDNLNSGINNY